MGSKSAHFTRSIERVASPRHSIFQIPDRLDNSCQAQGCLKVGGSGCEAPCEPENCHRRYKQSPLVWLYIPGSWTTPAKTANTHRAYQSDWHDFSAWCEARGLAALPAVPITVALYLSDLAERRTVSTLQRRLATISQAHQAAHLETPTRAAEVRAVMQGIHRAKGSAQRQMAPAVMQIIRAMIECLPDSPLGARPGANPTWLRGCLPPLGACRARRGRCQLHG